MTELKPCPFCGGEAQVNYSFGSLDCFVACKNRKCRAQIPGWFDKEEKAIEAWNRRAGK